jgi:hypothetical protein
VVNAGIGGHRLLGDEVGERGLARFDRDVLAVPGVGHVVAHFGLNDLRLPGVFGFDTVTAEQLIDGLTELGRPRPIRRHRVHAATVVPFGGSATLDSPAARRTRAEVNEWIRHGTHSRTSPPRWPTPPPRTGFEPTSTPTTEEMTSVASRCGRPSRQAG